MAQDEGQTGRRKGLFQRRSRSSSPKKGAKGSSSSLLERVHGEERGGFITARGTGEGLVLRIDGRVEGEQLIDAVITFVEKRKSFIGGEGVTIEWTGQEPDRATVKDLRIRLKSKCGVEILSTGKVDRRRNRLSEGSNFHPSEDAPSLFDGIGDLASSAETSRYDSGSGQESFDSDIMTWDDPDARLVYSTLRSGQRVETEHSLILVGDVNSGAEVVAGGDIIVLGTLRGVAHAGAFDETGGGRFIFSLDLRPTQLRIGSVISRGASDQGSVPEIARVDGSMIVVEPFKARNLMNRIQSVRSVTPQTVSAS